MNPGSLGRWVGNEPLGSGPAGLLPTLARPGGGPSQVGRSFQVGFVASFEQK